MLFHKRLKELRIEANLSQKQLANAIDVNEISISKWENGKRKPSLKYAIGICNFFHVSLDYILGIDNNKTKSKKSA